MPDSNVQRAGQDGCLVLTIKEAQVRGDGLAESLRLEFLEAVDQTGCKKVAVDLRNVELITTVAFRPLLSLRRKLHDLDGKLVLCGLSPMVAEVFRVTRLISTGEAGTAPFEAQPDLAAALVHLNKN
jgi:anti-anti-sigma factor